MNESEVLPLLARLFPSFQGIPPEEARRRGEVLGIFAARAVRAGVEAMAAKGLKLSAQAVATLDGDAREVLSCDQGGSGLGFLGRMRPAIADDHVYAAALRGLASLYAESLRGGAPTFPESAPAPLAVPPPAAPPAPAPQEVGGFVLPGPPMESASAASYGASLEFTDAPARAAPVAPPSPVAPPPPAPAPAGGGLDFGSLDLADEPARAPYVAPPSPVAPPASGGSGDLDLAPLDLADEPARAPYVPPPGPVAPPASGGSGDLDLAPLDLAGEPARAPAPPPPAPAPAASGGGMYDLAPEDEPEERPRAGVEDLLYGQDDPAEEAAASGGAPRDPAARAIWSFEQTGDLSHLQQAAQLIQAEIKSAPHVMAAATAQGGLAKVAMLQGDRATAQRLAAEALAHFPSCPSAVEILVRLERGEAEAASYRRGLTMLRFALKRRDLGQVRSLADAMIKGFADEPLPHLARVFAGHVSSDADELRRHLAAAWARYPSQTFAAETFGGEVDAEVATVLLSYGRAPYKNMEEEGLLQTINDTDSKENLIAGSLRMAVGLAKVSLARGGEEQPRPLLRRLHTVVGQGMMGLQYFEAAPEEFGKALMLAPSPEEHKAISNERLKCQALWRAFDKPGIKVQQKKFRCIGAEGLSTLYKARLDAIYKDRQARQEELYGKGAQIVAQALKDPGFRREITAAAEEQAVPDPVAEVEGIDAELAEIEAELAGGGAPVEEPKKKGGLFGALKAAASSVGSAARGAQLKFKTSQLQTKRSDAERRVAITLATQLNEYEFKQPFLLAFARKAASLEAFNDYYEGEESQVKQQIQALSFAK